jgi:hypothetical protein
LSDCHQADPGLPLCHQLYRRPVGLLGLAPDVGQLAGLKPRVVFEDGKKVARFDAAVLTRIADEDQPGIVSLHEFAKVGALARTRDAGFVDDEGRAPQLRTVVLFRVLQEIAQGRRIRKPLFTEHLGRRRRGRTSEDGALKSLQATLHLLQSRCFPGARDAPQGADAVGGIEQRGDRLALVG